MYTFRERSTAYPNQIENVIEYVTAWRKGQQQSIAEVENLQYEVVEARLHSNGKLSLARVNAYHSNMESFWPEGKETLPPTKYLNLGLGLFWWLNKHKDLTLEQKVEAILGYIKDQPFDLNRKEVQTLTVEIDFKFTGIPTKL